MYNPRVTASDNSCPIDRPMTAWVTGFVATFPVAQGALGHCADAIQPTCAALQLDGPSQLLRCHLQQYAVGSPPFLSMLTTPAGCVRKLMCYDTCFHISRQPWCYQQCPSAALKVTSTDHAPRRVCHWDAERMCTFDGMQQRRVLCTGCKHQVCHHTSDSLHTFT